jgi:hypothetical protein
MADTTFDYQFSANLNNTTETGTITGNFTSDYTTDRANGSVQVTTPNGTTNFTIANANISNGAGDPNQFTLNSTATNGDVLSLTYTGQTPTSFDSGSFQDVNSGQSEFSVVAPETITSTNTTACYVTGTLIRTIRGDIAVENLAVGDIVVTASGKERPIKWIGHRGYAGRFANTNPDVLPICFKANSLADGVPARDLWVSPKHAMFLDDALVPAEFLVNGVSVVKADRVESVTYWHVELDSHDVLMAEGAPSESFVDDCSRGMFINAHTFAALYPDQAEPVDAIYCAPRLEDGYQLEAIRQAIAARAGIATSVPDCGALQGYIDAIDNGILRGWARSALNPAVPVCLDVVIDGRVATQVLANRRRADLDAPGCGPHAFEIRLPEGVDGHAVEVRRSADGALVKRVLLMRAA